MKRWLLILAVLVAGVVSTARGHYVLIVYGLGAAPNAGNQRPNAGMPGVGGGMPGMPGGGGGGMPGMPGGGMPGMPGGGGGMPGMPGGGGGMPGMPGGGGGAPGMPGGPGAPRNQSQRQTLEPLQQPRPGAPGMPGGTPPGGRRPGDRPQPNRQPDLMANLPLFRAQAVVEYSRATDVPVAEADGKKVKVYSRINHKWGHTFLALDDPQLTVIPLKLPDGRPVPTVAERYRERCKELLKKGKKVTADDYVELAEWSLNHGLVDDRGFDKNMKKKLEDESYPMGFTQIMFQLEKVDDKHEVVQRYNQVREAMSKKAKPDTADFWAEKLSGYKVERSAHYALLYNSSERKPLEVGNRLDALEKNFEAFYYWFALKGRALKVPDHRLTAVLVEKPGEYVVQREIFEHPYKGDDGFYARDFDLAVFSMRPVNPFYDALEKGTRNLWSSGWNAADMLKGEGRKDKSNQEVARVQTIALLLKAMEESAELQAVTHNGSRQLAAAAELFPAGVNVPEWIQYGYGSFFETPTDAFWPGTAVPHWTYLEWFKGMNELRVELTPEIALRRTVTDYFFRNPEKVLLTVKDLQLKTKPYAQFHTLSWALTYFLAHQHLDGLLRYAEELNRLPRNLELGEDVLLITFARAFNLVDVGNPNQRDYGKFDRFAREWFKFMEGTALEMQNVAKEAGLNLNPPKPELKTPTPGVGGAPNNPGGPGVPGTPGGRPQPGPGGGTPGPGTPSPGGTPTPGNR